MQLLLALFDFNQSVGKAVFKYFKLNFTDDKSVTSTREKNTKLPAAVRASKTDVLNSPK